MNKVFGNNTMFKITKGIKRIIPAIPVWSNYFQSPPKLGVLKPKDGTVTREAESAIVYFPACISRTMGTYKGQEKNLMETFMSICRKAGIVVNMVNDVKGSCCGQIFSSKGFKEAYRLLQTK